MGGQSRREPAAGAPSRGQALAGAARDVGDRAATLWEDLRRTDRFFKMRAGIVGAWAILSVVTLWAACSSSSAPAGSLGAEVDLNRDSIMGVQILIRNESRRIWEDVTLTLDDGWEHAHQTLRPHDLVVLPMTSFTKGAETLPRDHVPRSLAISCRQGSERVELH